MTIEFRTARRGVRIVLFSCAGRERFATTRSGVRSCAVPMKRNLARAVFAHASNCGKRNSRPRRGGFASERGANGRADSLYASLVACASRLLACGVARRPFGNGFCGSAPNSARSAGRSVDLIFSPAPCGCRAFFVSARGVGFWILMRALRFAQDSRIESDHPRAVRGVVRFACGACGNHSAQVQNKNDSHSRRGRASKLPRLSDRLPGVSLRLRSVRDRFLSSDAS